MIPVPLIAFPLTLLGFLLVTAGTTFWGYEHGVAIQEARDEKAQNVQLRKDLEDHKINDAKANEAGKKFENEKPQIVTQVQYRDRTRDVFIPPDADPFVPIWFVRMFNDLARVEPPDDPYPGQSPDAPSRTRLSGTRPVLRAWVIKYETCRKQIDDIRELKPILPPPPQQEKTLLDKLGL